MAGPVDCRVNPTAVNALAISKPIEWFKKNLISRVPFPHAGYGRNVYPGFAQLTAFLSMNPERDKQAFANLHQHFADDEIDKTDTIRSVYNEYLAVNDLPADLYLETVEKVFQTYGQAVGRQQYCGRLVSPEAITRTALMTVEGERDDICSVGRTRAARTCAAACDRIVAYITFRPVLGITACSAAANGTSKFIRALAR